MPLTKSVIKPLAKSVLIPLGLTPGASATDAAIHNKMLGSGHPSDLAPRTATLIISDEEMNVTTKIVKSLEESVLLIKVVTKTIENEAKEKKVDFLECY